MYLVGEESGSLLVSVAFAWPNGCITIELRVELKMLNSRCSLGVAVISSLPKRAV